MRFEFHLFYCSASLCGWLSLTPPFVSTANTGPCLLSLVVPEDAESGPCTAPWCFPLPPTFCSLPSGPCKDRASHPRATAFLQELFLRHLAPHLWKPWLDDPSELTLSTQLLTPSTSSESTPPSSPTPPHSTSRGVQPTSACPRYHDGLHRPGAHRSKHFRVCIPPEPMGSSAQGCKLIAILLVTAGSSSAVPRRRGQHGVPSSLPMSSSWLRRVNRGSHRAVNRALPRTLLAQLETKRGSSRRRKEMHQPDIPQNGHSGEGPASVELIMDKHHRPARPCHG